MLQDVKDVDPKRMKLNLFNKQVQHIVLKSYLNAYSTRYGFQTIKLNSLVI